MLPSQYRNLLFKCFGKRRFLDDPGHHVSLREDFVELVDLATNVARLAFSVDVA